jgi:uncharacterized protein YbjQ (UPF0145 family)
MGPSLADLAVRALDAPQPSDGRSSSRSGLATCLSPGELIAIEEQGWEICGLATGASVFHVGLTGWPQGNTEVIVLSSTMYAAREKALTGLRQMAGRQGGEGVLDVHLDIHFMEDHRHLPQFVAIGTAVRQRGPKAKDAPPAQSTPFTAAVTALEFCQLIDAGYHPLGIVMGTCVHHVGRRQFSQWASSQRENVEMTTYTEALYEARELAMARLQTEALGYGADGVVGVTTTERSHVWRSHTIEFFAMGTAVRADGTTDDSAPPRMAVPLNDPSIATDPGAITGTNSEDR